MTREEAKKYLPLIQALADGKVVQEYNHESGQWEDSKNPRFVRDRSFYRIKPKIQYRPFKDVKECLEEMAKHQPIGWIKSSIGTLYNILEIGKSGIVTKNSISGFSTAINDFVFADGASFGAKEE